MKTVRKKNQVIYNKSIKIIAYFLKETLKARKVWNEVF
jgi:hypothetical protein